MTNFIFNNTVYCYIWSWSMEATPSVTFQFEDGLPNEID